MTATERGAAAAPGAAAPGAATEQHTFTAFAGNRRIVTGDVETMLRRTKARLDAGERSTVLIFDDATGGQVDFDFRGTVADVLARLPSHPLFAGRAGAGGMAGTGGAGAGGAGAGGAGAGAVDAGAADAAPRSGPGRPRLGVVSREVTLLPRHWEWLEQQPNGISAALRRLVEEARRREPGPERARRAREAAGRFMTVMAGDRPGYEEASRALYARDRRRLAALIRRWPADVRAHVQRLVAEAERCERAVGAAPSG
jgi:hypothetical protein